MSPSFNSGKKAHLRNQAILSQLSASRQHLSNSATFHALRGTFQPQLAPTGEPLQEDAHQQYARHIQESSVPSTVNKVANSTCVLPVGATDAK